MSMLSMQYAGTLMGREAVIDFPDSHADVRYGLQGQMVWRVVDALGHVSEGCEQVGYLQLSDSLHFLNWRESSGFTVSQFIDTAQGAVQAFWSCADARSQGGHRASMFVQGHFRLR